MAVDEYLCDVAATFVRLADTLVDAYDAVEFATMLSDESARLLGVDAAGVMLVAGPDELQSLACSDDRARALGFFELDCGEGPAVDAYRTGSVLDVPDLNRCLERWGRFAPYAIENGFEAVTAIPMWKHQNRIGVLNLFEHAPHALSATELQLAQGLADIASVGILSARRFEQEHVLARQLQRALASRVTIEQAKGVAAAHLGLGVDEAFVVIRHYARSNRVHLTDVANDIVAGRVSMEVLHGFPLR